MADSDKFDVILVDGGARKILVIKELRELHPDLPMEDIYRFIVNIPCPVMLGVSEAVAQVVKARLEEVDATVEIRTAGKVRA